MNKPFDPDTLPADVRPYWGQVSIEAMRIWKKKKRPALPGMHDIITAMYQDQAVEATRKYLEDLNQEIRAAQAASMRRHMR